MFNFFKIQASKPTAVPPKDATIEGARKRLPRVGFFALLLAFCVAVGNHFVWGAMGTTLTGADLPGRVNGLTYAPFARQEAPWVRHADLATTVEADFKQLGALTPKIRTYSALQFPELPRIASENGLRITLGAWLQKDAASNTQELAAAIEQAARYPAVERLVVGNETILKQTLRIDQLVGYLRAAKKASVVPVSTAEPWHVWIKHPELADEVDFITIHLLPYWEGLGLETAVQESFERLDRVRAKFPGKPIVIGEVGYPSQGDTIKKAQPSPAAQAAFVRQFVERAEREKLDYFLIEAYDQPWKISEEGRAGAYWGLFDAARQPKFALAGPIEPDPYWRVKAVSSSLAGFLFLAWFCIRFTNLRWPARLAFAVAAQGVLSLAAAMCTLPLLYYMSTADWVLMALLIPTSLVMVAIMLAHLFEFAELFWRGNLRRHFGPRPLGPNATLPFVSIHLACCNEPPDMVIATIKSLQNLDYPHFEVLVVDNNTQDDNLWQPIQAYMAKLPAHFRFFHLPKWPGFKAGALNFTLAQSDKRADVVAVVDADYVVRANWLRDLVGYFEDPQVGVVQAPQAHRDWGASVFRKMMNWEYEGFFRIGMHHRNERDAIIQHGTMTMIRARALAEHGAWSEWCICEDTELGLRLMRQGLQTVYVDAVMGEGLTPDSFADFKKQRKRWAQGGMQIFKAHATALLGMAPSGTTSHLTLGQRYHFLAGWLPWLGDALHMVFVFAALFWTAGALALPRYFSFPLALYLMPLAVFCSAKLVMGPLLYWRRVKCSWIARIGAALAGMALSHAIARGVFEGLLNTRGVFEITTKGQSKAKTQTAKQIGGATTPAKTSNWKAAREEILLLVALLLSVVAVALDREPGHMESAYWIVMLILQSLPYLAALLCAWAASRPEVQPAAALAPNTAALNAVV